MKHKTKKRRKKKKFTQGFVDYNYFQNHKEIITQKILATLFKKKKVIKMSVKVIVNHET